MAKLIFSIEDKIFISAKELFYEKGYEQVNMKDISKRAGIAVGSLYNYFSNKSELYLSVLESSWNDSFDKLETILEKDLEGREKIRLCVSLLYEETLERRCMGMQVRKAKDLKDNQSIKDMEKRIGETIKAFFKGVELKEEFKEDRNILDKIVYSLLINLSLLIDYYPEDQKSNIEYLYKGAVTFFK